VTGTVEVDDEDDDLCLFGDIDYLDIYVEETQQSIEELEADKLYCDDDDDDNNNVDE
jgi:hypothetical protein